MRRRTNPRPVLKWAGGKAQLLEPILKALPAEISTYYEPFIGGGAVFFELARRQRFERAVIADRNADLVAMYRALRDDVDAVIAKLRQYRYDRELYYEVRDQQPRSDANRAARLIFLNKTGYNGLYRVNRSGKFNVPFGRYKNPRILDEANLRSVAEVLSGVKIEHADFEQICARAQPGDAVYFDPPYLPLSATSNFSAYEANPFGLAEHERLGRAFDELTARGVHAVVSNSDTPDTRRIFRARKAHTVAATRAINSNPERRGAISELLVSNARRLRRASGASAT